MTGKHIFKCWELQILISWVNECVPAEGIEATLKKNTTQIHNVVDSCSKYADINSSCLILSSCEKLALLFCKSVPNTNYMHTAPNKYSLMKVITQHK